MAGHSPTSGDIVVLSFGGTTIDGAAGLREVAHRLVAAREQGLRVVGTISAPESAAEALQGLAHGVAREPAPRELAMLLSTAERTACALVAMAIHDLGHDAVSLAGSQAGVLTDSAHTDATIQELTPVRILEALEAGKIVLVAGGQGFSRETMDLTRLAKADGDATARALAEALGASHVTQ